VSAPHQSLCAEMTDELCFALRCRGSRQRPALKRQCSRCIPGNTYVPAGLDLPPHPPAPNGLRSPVSTKAPVSKETNDTNQSAQFNSYFISAMKLFMRAVYQEHFWPKTNCNANLFGEKIRKI